MREEFLGNEKKRFSVVYLWIDDSEQGISHEDFATYYDTREYQPNRKPELRLYYSGNPVTDIMQPGDTLFVAKRKGIDTLFFVVVNAGTAIFPASRSFSLSIKPAIAD